MHSSPSRKTRERRLSSLLYWTEHKRLLWNSSVSFELCKHKKHAAEHSYTKYVEIWLWLARNRLETDTSNDPGFWAVAQIYSNDRIDYRYSIPCTVTLSILPSSEAFVDNSLGSDKKVSISFIIMLPFLSRTQHCNWYYTTPTSMCCNTWTIQCKCCRR